MKYSSARFIDSGHWRCSIKKLFLYLYQKETPTQVFPCEYCKIFKSTYFVEYFANGCFSVHGILRNLDFNWSPSSTAMPPFPLPQPLPHSSLLFGVQNLTWFCWITSYPAVNPTFFLTAIWLRPGQFWDDVDHSVLSILDRRVTGNPIARLSP